MRSAIKGLKNTVKDHFLYGGVKTTLGLTQPNAAVEVPDINWLFYHPKILAVMRKLLGQEEIMFTSHCDLHLRLTHTG